VVGGLIALVVVLAAASVAGFAVRQRQGRFRAVRQASPLPASAGMGAAGLAAAGGAGGRDAQPAAPGGPLSAEDLGAPLGSQVTLVQFSSAACAYCGPTRELLAEVAGERDGVAFVEIDAAARMDLTRRLRVLATPTVLVLDALGAITSRASGPLRKADLLTAVGAARSTSGNAP
jgi:protein-disulfide isomerase